MARTTLIALRRGTAAQWAAVNPVLAAGEPGLETDTGHLKLGDGTTTWAALPYIAPAAATPSFPAEISAVDYKATGLPGATALSRYVGAVSGAAPSAGPFLVGDWVADRAGGFWTCIAAGNPGTWTKTATAADIANGDNINAAAIAAETTRASAAENLTDAAIASETGRAIAAETAALSRDGSRSLTGNLDANSHKIVNLTDPTAAADAASKAYVDAHAGGGGTGSAVITVGKNDTAADYNTANYATDDLAVQAAVNSIATSYAAGIQIRIKVGVYDFVGPVDSSAKHNIAFRGDGPGTIIRWKNANTFANNTAAANWCFNLGDYQTLSDLQLQGFGTFTCTINGVATFNAGAGTNTLGGGVKINGARTWIDRLYITGMAEDGITTAAGALSPKISAVEIIGCGGYGLNVACTDGDATSVWIGSCLTAVNAANGGWSFTAGHWWGSQQYGAYENAGGNRYVGCYIETNGYWGIFINGRQGVSVTGCDIWANGYAGATAQYGGIGLAGASNINVIRGNKLRDNRGDAIQLTGSSNGNVVDGNAITDSLATNQATRAAKAAVTNGNTNGTSANFSIADNSQITFTYQHVGCTLKITGAGVAGATLTTQIAAYVSATQVTLGTAASTSVNPASFTIGAVLHQIAEFGTAGNNTIANNLASKLDQALGQVTLNASATIPSSTANNMGHDARAYLTVGNAGSGSLSPDVRNGRVYDVTLTANVTTITPFGLQTKSQELVMIIRQDATGGRTATGWTSTFVFAGGNPPTLSTAANAIDVVAFVYDGAKLRETWRSLAASSPVVLPIAESDVTNLTADLAAKLAAASNLSDLNNAATSRTNLGVAIGTNVAAWDADLDALAALGSTGLAARTAANTWAQRSLAVGSAKLTVTNPAGVAGNPTLDLGSVASSDLSDGSTLATKAYADAIKAAIPSEAECEWATAAALPAYVYANGASGVGATLTGVSVGALTVDGNTPAVGDDVLVKNEAGANRAYHGPYRVTTVGSGVAVYVLTRRTDWDQAAEIAGGDTFFVQGGSANQGTTWTLNLAEGTAVTVGTTVLPFIQTSGPGTIVAGTGIGVSGSTVSIDTATTVDKTTAQTMSSKTLTSPVLNTGVSGTAIDADSTMAANSDTILATQKAIKTALALKANLASPTFTGTVAGITATMVGLGNVTNDAQVKASIGTAKGDLVGFSASATPVRAGVGSDGQVLTADAASTPGFKWAAAAGGGGSVATDTLWDAKGDLAVGTGADTAAKLTIGSNNQVLVADSTQTTGQKWATAPIAGGGTGQTTAQAAINALSGLTTAGDVEIFDGTNTTRLATTTAAGAAIVADPNAAAKISVQYPHGVEAASRGATSALATTFDRAHSLETNITPLSTGRLTLVRILLPKGLPVTTITFYSMTTALATGANQWFALFDSSRNKLAITGDDTSTAWAANTAKTLTVTSGPYVTTTAGWFYLGIMVKATTVPTMAGTGNLGTANFRAAAPLPCGTADSSLTNPASCPSTAAALSLLGQMIYAEVS